MARKAKRPGRPRKVQVLVSQRPMSLKSLAKLPGLQVPVLDAVDPRTRRMVAHAIGQAEAGKQVKIGITTQNQNFAHVQVPWLEKVILARPNWFQYNGVFLHRSGGEIHAFSMREGINAFRTYYKHKNELTDKDAIVLFDPVELEAQTKDLRAELHRWDE